MDERFTLERILRDDDDASGQSVREWALTIDGNHLTIRGRSDGHVLLIRLDDIDQLKRDLDRCLSVHYAGDPA